MQDLISKEVQDVLTIHPDAITLEHLQSENQSPLNQPVIEKDIGGQRPIRQEEKGHIWKPKTISDTEHQSSDSNPNFRDTVETTLEEEKAAETLDAPEQEIGDPSDDSSAAEVKSNQDFELPLSQANQAADALLGISNNVLVVGGGFFVKLKKHKDFYEFEEIIQVIDQQNDRNIERIKLTKDDQILLRPLLAQVLRQKTKQLTPEQQLMGAVLSILVKKAQVVMEVRAENSLLEDRILDIIRKQKEELKADNDELDREQVESNTTESNEKRPDNHDSFDLETEPIVSLKKE